MPALSPRNSTSSNQALRASLLAADSVEHPAAPTAATVAETRLPDLGTSLLPTAPELLEASPNLLRLCESYHRTYRHMLARNRRQRLGLAMLVAAVGAAAVGLSQSHTATVAMASDLVVAVGLASGVGVALLALLWVRDDRRLRRVQGDRLLRALQFNCTLHEERLHAFRRLSHPTAAFFDCYALWRERNPDRVSGVAAMVRSLRSLGGATG
jgi:hypothetical protein